MKPTTITFITAILFLASCNQQAKSIYTPDKLILRFVGGFDGGRTGSL